MRDGRWTCKCCWRFSRRRHGLARKRCLGSAVASWADRERSLRDAGGGDGPRHVRWLTDGIVWCSRCGSYAVSWAVGLRKSCGGAPSCDGMRAVRNHLRAYRHPVTHQPLRGPHVPEPPRPDVFGYSVRDSWGSGVSTGVVPYHSFSEQLPAVTAPRGGASRIEAVRNRMLLRLRTRQSACGSASSSAADGALCSSTPLAEISTSNSAGRVDASSQGSPLSGHDLHHAAAPHKRQRVGTEPLVAMGAHIVDVESTSVTHDAAAAAACPPTRASKRDLLGNPFVTVPSRPSDTCYTPSFSSDMAVDMPPGKARRTGSVAPEALFFDRSRTRKRTATTAALDDSVDAVAAVASAVRRSPHLHDQAGRHVSSQRPVSHDGIPSSVRRDRPAETQRALLRSRLRH